MTHYAEYQVNAKYYNEHGGDLSKPPYFDRAEHISETGTVYPVRRVFVSADWFPGWTEWKAQAELAADAAMMGADYCGRWCRRSDVPPLAITPRYILERDGKTGVFHIWINVCLSLETEADFIRVKDEARKRIDTYTELHSRLNALADLQPGCPRLELTKYAPAENVVEEGSFEFRVIRDSFFGG